MKVENEGGSSDTFHSFLLGEVILSTLISPETLGLANGTFKQQIIVRSENDTIHLFYNGLMIFSAKSI